jgi:hypothetical protein
MSIEMNNPKTLLEKIDAVANLVEQNNKIFTVTENGFSMTSHKVCIPACRIKAKTYIEATEKLSAFLSTRQPNADIELITPLENIEFTH